MITTLRTTLLAFLFTLCANAASSQISVVSLNGYTVNIAIIPTSIVTNSNNCTWGYNYNVRLDYNISFTGTNIPSSLYTLQGTMGCGSSTHFFDLPNNGGIGSVTSQSNVWNSNSDCATATINSLQCKNINIEINGPGINSRIITIIAATLPLPVTLVDFNATIVNEQVRLNWSTATESNNDYFTIERSADGAVWDELTRIKGAGNSSSLLSYTYYDENPPAGISYYRLKQTDLDGRSVYSAIRSVKSTQISSISIFPVPNSGRTIHFRGIRDGNGIVMTVKNLTGITLFNTLLQNTSEVMLPSLAPGLYIISLTDKIEGKTTNLRYMQL